MVQCYKHFNYCSNIITNGAEILLCLTYLLYMAAMTKTISLCGLINLIYLCVFQIDFRDQWSAAVNATFLASPQLE